MAYVKATIASYDDEIFFSRLLGNKVRSIEISYTFTPKNAGIKNGTVGLYLGTGGSSSTLIGSRDLFTGSTTSFKTTFVPTVDVIGKEDGLTTFSLRSIGTYSYDVSISSAVINLDIPDFSITNSLPDPVYARGSYVSDSPVRVEFTGRAGSTSGTISVQNMNGNVLKFINFNALEGEYFDLEPQASWYGSGSETAVQAVFRDRSFNREKTIILFRVRKIPDFSMSASTSAVAIGDKVTLTFANRYDMALSVSVSCNGTNLTTLQAESDSLTFTIEKSWLSSIGSAYATLDITATDPATGRTAECSIDLSVHGIEFTLSKATAKADVDKVGGSIDYRYDEPVRVRVKYGSALIEEIESWTSDDFSLSPKLEWFTKAGETADSMSVTVEVRGLYTEREDAGGFEVTRSVLTVSATNPVTAGNGVTLAFGERNGSTLTVKLRSGDTILASPASFSADGLTVATQQKWFQDLSVTTQNYTEVTVDVTASDGRIASTTFRLEAGDDMAPTISGITFSAEQPTAAMRSAFPGIYVAGYTRLKVSATVSAKYSASAWQVNFTIAGSAPTEMSQSSGSKWEGVSINPVTVNGDVVVSVVDSRGLRSESKLRFSSITAYSAPSVSAISFHRCQQDRTKDDNGGYCLISATFTITPVEDKNSKSAAIASSVYSDSKTLSSYTQTLEWFFAADIEHSYEITLSAIDTVTRMDVTVRLSTAGVIMDFLAGGKGIGLGKVAEYSNAVEVNPEWTLKVGSIELNGSDLGQLLQQIDQRLRNGGL